MSNNSIELAKLLVDRKLLIKGMTISAKVSTTGFGHAVVNTVKQGVITEVSPEGLTAIFDDKKKRKTGYENIVAIEGMEIARFAQAYRVKINGKEA